jgi:hypothetical protein
MDHFFTLVGERRHSRLRYLEEALIKTKQFLGRVAKRMFTHHFHRREKILHDYYCYLNNSKPPQ